MLVSLRPRIIGTDDLSDLYPSTDEVSVAYAGFVLFNEPMYELLDRHRAVILSWMSLYDDDPIEFASASGRRVTDGAERTQRFVEYPISRGIRKAEQ